MNLRPFFLLLLFFMDIFFAHAFASSDIYDCIREVIKSRSLEKFMSERLEKLAWMSEDSKYINRVGFSLGALLLYLQNYERYEYTEDISKIKERDLLSPDIYQYNKSYFKHNQYCAPCSAANAIVYLEKKNKANVSEFQIKQPEELALEISRLASTSSSYGTITSILTNKLNSILLERGLLFQSSYHTDEKNNPEKLLQGMILTLENSGAVLMSVRSKKYNEKTKVWVDHSNHMVTVIGIGVKKTGFLGKQYDILVHDPDSHFEDSMNVHFPQIDVYSFKIVNGEYKFHQNRENRAHTIRATILIEPKN